MNKTENDLYYVSQPNPNHKGWGVYRRSKRGRLFHLVAISLTREEAVLKALELFSNDEVSRYAVQSSRYDHLLPQRYDP